MLEENTYPNLKSASIRFIRFIITTGIIFIISFLAINFDAYKSILSSIVNADTLKEKSKILSDVTENSSMNETLLLPVSNTQKEMGQTYAWLDFPVVPTDNRLVIPKLGKSVPIVETTSGSEQLTGKNWVELENQIQESLRNGVVHYPNTAKPGQYGNVFITGHSSYYPWDSGQYKDVFSMLYTLEVGDEYYVYYDQKKYVYKISERRIVKPNQIEILEQPKDKLISTLMTCYPTGFSTERLVIVANQIVES